MASNKKFDNLVDVHDRLQLRKILRARRRALSSEARTRATAKLTAVVTKIPAVLNSNRLSLYLTNDGEIDTSGIIKWCEHNHKKCYAPVVAADKKNKQLKFRRYRHDHHTKQNYFGIAEPSGEEIDIGKLDLVLLPLVGFDINGNRLGMGGGFYDFTLAAETNPPVLIGLAYECQRVEKLDAADWDIPLAMVATEKRVYHCRH